MRWANHVAKCVPGKPTGRGFLGMLRRKWEDNIKIDLEEIGINVENWADSA